MFKNNVYNNLEELFIKIDKFKEALIEKKDNERDVNLYQKLIKYNTDIINSTMVGTNGIFGGIRNV